MSVWPKGIISFAVMNSAPRYDSAAEDMISLMIVVMVRTGPLKVVVGSFYDRNMRYPERMCDKR